MVGLHRNDHFWICAKLLENAHTDVDMRTLYFMVKRLADVMHERTGFCNLHISAKFLGNHASDVCHLNRMLQNILSITCTEVQSSKNSDDARIEIKYTAFV